MFMALHAGVNASLIGASGAISGLMGAVFRLMYAAEDARGRHLLRERPIEAPRLKVVSMLTRRAPLVAIAAWVGINVVVGVAMSSFGGGIAIAWEAHLGGFFAGLLMFELFDRGCADETLTADASW